MKKETVHEFFDIKKKVAGEDDGSETSLFDIFYSLKYFYIKIIPRLFR